MGSLGQRESTDRIIVLTVVFVLATAAATVLTSAWRGPAIGWATAATVWDLMVWRSVGRLDPAGSREHARARGVPHRVHTILLNAATIAATVTVGLLIYDSTRVHGDERILLSLFGLIAVCATWTFVHLLFMLQYASQHYSDHADGDTGRGIDFNQPEAPRYTDFAYTAFTFGMTYAASDTSFTAPEIRRTALVHAFYSFYFGTAVTATTVNLVVSLF
ncbi:MULTISPECIES: DUF1345 domain-containing protein [Corynebacterium]|uniref:DUF1345 domain-containing protein n=1 Tax=Corynebacterium meridianum TaxID=2765363 RepID=A0A934I6R1_9CORY|nr:MULTISPECIES: DUF1345 domain-containing protein [Corynebacterium]MBI8989349.1 DUF1345 domain-containing protein [Corynebacterium meridianum]MBV7292154.1 DUF1345 domain-containing protein [Corynebacterium sp. TAE3-ERU16]MCK7676982.1 DUF1345 domain-containing protein [Corynebacterium meridianum]